MFKTILISLILAGGALSSIAQVKLLKGSVRSSNNEPIAYANVYIEGTTDGVSTDENGIFNLETEAKGTLTLIVSLIGYKTFSKKADVSELNNLSVILQEETKNLKEIVISAGNFNLKGTSNIEGHTAIDLVTAGGSEGDLYKAIKLLPGVQTSGVDGKMQVRGGSSHESQTYIDDMHVMVPYNTMPNNTGARGKQSMFIFETINFSTGGYSPEYSQSLSSILPMETKDESKLTKIGSGISSIGPNVGGTKSWKNASTSFETAYTNIGPYTKLVFPNERKDWSKYYQMVTVQNQTRFTLQDNAILKFYLSYDKTNFEKRETKPFIKEQRLMDLDENNAYLNTTFKKRTYSGIIFFAGAAYSWNNKEYKNANNLGDKYKALENELHLKTKFDKRFSKLYKLGGGVETMIRKHNMTYTDTSHINRDINYSVNGMYVTNDFNLMHCLLLNVSGRLEYASLDKSWAVLPRIALNYNPLNDIILSASIGRYQQTTSNSYLVYNKHLAQEKTTQFILSAKNNITNYRVFNFEAYYKKYDKLTTYRKDIYTSVGKGYSWGIDLLYKDGFVIRKGQSLEYMLTYSYNDTKRKFGKYTDKIEPNFVTKHNSSISLKYWNNSIKSLIGIASRFTSGRTYHDPNKQGIMNSRTTPFNTVDISWSFLAHKKLIIFASASNIFGRDNIYGYQYNSVPDTSGKFVRIPIKSYQKQFFFIGFFFNFGKNVAYDVSNF